MRVTYLVAATAAMLGESTLAQGWQAWSGDETITVTSTRVQTVCPCLGTLPGGVIGTTSTTSNGISDVLTSTASTTTTSNGVSDVLTSTTSTMTMTTTPPYGNSTTTSFVTTTTNFPIVGAPYVQDGGFESVVSAALYTPGATDGYWTASGAAEFANGPGKAYEGTQYTQFDVTSQDPSGFITQPISSLENGQNYTLTYEYNVPAFNADATTADCSLISSLGNQILANTPITGLTNGYQKVTIPNVPGMSGALVINVICNGLTDGQSVEVDVDAVSIIDSFGRTGPSQSPFTTTTSALTSTTTGFANTTTSSDITTTTSSSLTTTTSGFANTTTSSGATSTTTTDATTTSSSSSSSSSSTSTSSTASDVVTVTVTSTSSSSSSSSTSSSSTTSDVVTITVTSIDTSTTTTTSASSTTTSTAPVVTDCAVDGDFENIPSTDLSIDGGDAGLASDWTVFGSAEFLNDPTNAFNGLQYVSLAYPSAFNPQSSVAQTMSGFNTAETAAITYYYDVAVYNMVDNDICYLATQVDGNTINTQQLMGVTDPTVRYESNTVNFTPTSDQATIAFVLGCSGSGASTLQLYLDNISVTQVV